MTGLEIGIILRKLQQNTDLLLKPAVSQTHMYLVHKQGTPDYSVLSCYNLVVNTTLTFSLLWTQTWYALYFAVKKGHQSSQITYMYFICIGPLFRVYMSVGLSKGSTVSVTLDNFRSTINNKLLLSTRQVQPITMHLN